MVTVEGSKRESKRQRGGRRCASQGGPRAATLVSGACSRRSARTEVRSGKTMSATGRGNGPSSASPCRSTGWQAPARAAESVRRSGSSHSASFTASPAWPICASSTVSTAGSCRPLYTFLLLDPIYPGRRPVLRPGDVRLPPSVPARRDRPHRHPLRHPDDVPLVGYDAAGVPCCSSRALLASRTSSWPCVPAHGGVRSGLLLVPHPPHPCRPSHRGGARAAHREPRARRSPAAPFSPRSATSSARRSRGSSPRST